MRLEDYIARPIVVLTLLLVPVAEAEAPPMDAATLFAEQVAPVLQERCLSCHGADERKGGFQLHTLEALSKGGASEVPAIVAGDPEASELLRRVAAHDPDERMPPKGAPLSEEQVAAIRQWIMQGAAWDDAVMAKPYRPGQSHWAFKPPVQHEAPTSAMAAWARNPIDQFLLEKMESAGLRPSPEADRSTLIRRLHLDLIGLPPTPDEVVAFVTDNRPDAYERLVERLLASPHYGERQAIRWLDIARYADTNGYEKDRHRSTWPYRDWVIQAFNEDKPFDQFTVEQLAGDLLPNATPAQRIATGFLRNSLYNEEGGVDVEEFRFEAMVDRVATTATAFLGLTMSCAQCHDHKYDPISHREYYEFFGFLNNTENAVMEVRTPEIEQARAAKQAEIDAAMASLEAQFPSGPPEDTEARESGAYLEERLAAWTSEKRALSREWSVLDPVAYTSAKTATLNRLDDRSILVSGECPNIDTYTVSFRTDQADIAALRLEALTHPFLPGGGPGRGMIMSPDGDFFLSEVRAYAAPWNAPNQRQPLPLGAPTASFAAEGRGVALAVDGQVDTGWSVNGGQGESHVAVFPLAQPIPQYDGGTLLTLELEHFYVHQHTLGRFRVSATSGGSELATSGLPAEIESLLIREESSLSEAERARIKAHFLGSAPELADAHKQIAALRKELPAFPTALVLEARSIPRPTRMHHRGEYLHPTEAVSPATPAALHPFPETWPQNRLSFARWLVSEENPLLARVTVNRAWQMLFGRGIVETTEDFGLMATPPSHPELLDWLAVEFQRRGYSMKELLRMVVTSAAYRQSSNVTPEQLRLDPQNRLMARAPRTRLDAELIRDTTLAASGLLVDTIGGPSVFPPISPEVFELTYTQGASVWPTSTGNDRFRRGVYTYVKRLVPYPSASTFDMPARDVVCSRRTPSNTPLQALTLLNDSEFFYAARAMAARVLRSAPADDAERLRLACLLALSREPDGVERTTLLEFLRVQRESLAAAEADLTSLLHDAPVEDVSPTEQAAWTALCRVLLNLDETISRS